MTLADVKIAQFNPTRDSLDALTTLLNNAYKPLAAVGLNYVAATQSSTITAARLADGTGYVAKADGGIIGTITYYGSVKTDHGHPAFYKNPEVAHFGQFAVAPEWQSFGIGSLLLTAVERHAASDGKKIIACDTAEPAKTLIDYYQRRGYLAIGHQQWEHALYRSVILRKELKS